MGSQKRAKINKNPGVKKKIKTPKKSQCRCCGSAALSRQRHTQHKVEKENKGKIKKE